MKPIEILKALKLEILKNKHPNFPVHAIPIPKYSDKTANGLTKMVVEWLQLNNHQAERINSMGLARIEKGMKDEVFNRGTPQKITWTPSTGQKGTADISSTIHGYSVKWEVKVGKDRQSDHQKKYEQSVKSAGGLYFIIKDFNGFMEIYDKLIDKLKPLVLDF